MKMTKQHYKILKDKLDTFIEKNLQEVKDHKSLRLGVDVDRRFRYDMFWAIQKHSFITEMKEYNDTHINTALKHYFSVKGDLWL